MKTYYYFTCAKDENGNPYIDGCLDLTKLQLNSIDQEIAEIGLDNYIFLHELANVYTKGSTMDNRHRAEFQYIKDNYLEKN